MALGNSFFTPPLFAPDANEDALAYLAELLPENTTHTTDPTSANGLYLSYIGGVLSLNNSLQKGQVTVDFAAGRLDYRRQKGGGEQIAKAVNYKENKRLIDATAGLGRDSFILASHGIEVYLFERHPIVSALLQDGIHRASVVDELAPIVQNMHLYRQAFSFDAAHDIEKVDVVYLDPMYPVRQKSAAIKKEMAYFHDLVGVANSDEARMLQDASLLAKKRIVVKRPRLGAFLNQVKPAYQYEGKSTRFDVYLPESIK